MRFPRLPWGPEVPPPTTDEGAAFTFWLVVVVALIAFVVGVIYATGVGQNNRGIGLGLLGASVACLYPLRRIAALRKAAREAESKTQ